MQIKKPEKTSSVTNHSNEKILVCNHVKRQPCWLTKQYFFFSQNLPEQRVYIPVYFLKNLRRYSYESGHHPCS